MLSFEKTGNTWWVKCTCDTWFPASEEIVNHRSIKMLCPSCKCAFDAAEAADLLDPAGRPGKPHTS